MAMERITRFFRAFIERFQYVRATELAAQMAFYLLLSLFPFLIFVVSLLPNLGFNGQEFIELIRPIVPEQGMAIVDENLSAIFARSNAGLLSFGIIATIWSASNAINGIIRGLNHAYEIEETRSFIVSRLLAIVLTLGMIAVIVIALVLPVFGKVIGEFIFVYLNVPDNFVVIWEAIRWLLSFVIISSVITFLYYIGPNKKLKFRDVIVGGFVATAGWLIASYGFSFYVSNFGNYSATYGSLGGVIVLMLWFYVSALVLLIGGILNVVLQHENG